MNLDCKKFQLYDCVLGSDDKEYCLISGKDHERKWVLTDWDEADDCKFKNLQLERYPSSFYESPKKEEKKPVKKKQKKSPVKGKKKAAKALSEAKPDPNKLPKKRGRPKKNPIQSDLNIEVKSPGKPRGRPPKGN